MVESFDPFLNSISTTSTSRLFINSIPRQLPQRALSKPLPAFDPFQNSILPSTPAPPFDLFRNSILPSKPVPALPTLGPPLTSTLPRKRGNPSSSTNPSILHPLQPKKPRTA